MSPAEHDPVLLEGGQLAVAMTTAATSGQMLLAIGLLDEADPEVLGVATASLLASLAATLTLLEEVQPGFTPGVLHALGTAFAS